MSTHQAALKPPYFVEIHGPYGHAIMPDAYTNPENAMRIANALQERENDGTYYCISDKDQRIIYCSMQATEEAR